jgi:hypothetical protein
MKYVLTILSLYLQAYRPFSSTRAPEGKPELIVYGVDDRHYRDTQGFTDEKKIALYFAILIKNVEKRQEMINEWQAAFPWSQNLNMPVVKKSDRFLL